MPNYVISLTNMFTTMTSRHWNSLSFPPPSFLIFTILNSSRLGCVQTPSFPPFLQTIHSLIFSSVLYGSVKTYRCCIKNSPAYLHSLISRKNLNIFQYCTKKLLSYNEYKLQSLKFWKNNVKNWRKISKLDSVSFY